MGRLTPGLGNPVFLPFIVSVSSPVSTQLQSNLSKFGEKSQGTWTAGPGVFGRGPSCWSLGADGLLEVYLGNSQLQGCLAVWPWVGPKASALQLFLTGTGSHHRVRRGLGSLREQVHLREEPPKGASWCFLGRGRVSSWEPGPTPGGGGFPGRGRAKGNPGWVNGSPGLGPESCAFRKARAVAHPTSGLPAQHSALPRC